MIEGHSGRAGPDRCGILARGSKRMPNSGECGAAGATTVQEYLNDEFFRCEQDLRRLTLQLSIDRDYVGSPEAEAGEIDYFRLQVQLEQLEVEFLTRRLGILKRWQRL